MIDTEILQDYSNEARELLEEMDNSLMRVEKEGGSPELLNNIFRAVHCIKGSAEYIGLERSSTLTHGVENLLDRVREGSITLDARVIDFLFRVKDLILTLIAEVSEFHQEQTPISSMMQELEEFLPKSPVRSMQTFEPAEEASVAENAQSDEPVSQESETSEEAAGTDLKETAAPPGAPEEQISRDSDSMESEGERFYEYFSSETSAPDPGEVEQTQVETEASASTAQEPSPFNEEPVLADPEAEPTLSTEEEAESDFRLADALEPNSETSVEDTVPHILNVSLYLDDLEDGLQPAEVMSSILETLGSLAETMRAIGIPAAVGLLRSMEERLSAIPSDRERLSSNEIQDLRTLLHGLREWYPEGLFPLEEEVPSSLDAASETRPFLDASLEPSAFRRALEQIPGLQVAVIEALEKAGFSSLEQLASTDLHTLTDIPTLTPSTAEFILKIVGGAPSGPKPPPPSRKPGDRSMLADVDDELLLEFEGIFGDGKAGAEPHAATSNPIQPALVADLLEELDTIGEDTDREIIEIFLSYAWEITDKLRRLSDKIKQGTADRGDMEASAELIKSIRSSSSYMDYQNLAAFLDEWHEKVIWCSERMDSVSPKNLVFMEESLLKFERFLSALESAVNSNGFVAVKGAGPIGAKKPSTSATNQTAPYSAGQREAREATISNQGFADVLRSPETRTKTPSERVVQEMASPPERSPQEATTEEILRAMKPGPSMQPQTSSETASVDDGATTSEITGSQETKFLQDLATARDTRESSMVRTMRVDSVKVDVLLNQVGELVVNRSYVEQLSLELKNLHRILTTTREVSKKDIQSVKDLSLKVGEASLSLGRVANDIQEGVMKLRMLPVGQLFNRMPRLIRDLSRRVGKSVGLEVHGGDTEVDKRVVEQIYNPLVHLIRNAVDHGIEDRDARKRLGKSEEGSIRLNAYSQGNQVVIDVEDDGNGIDYDAVIQKAIETRLIDAQEAKNVTSQEVYNFLFLPGFSTSKRVTRTSGRGVGMDVVKKDVEKINGHIEIESWENQGTRISIKIPLTLAIIQTLLIRMGKHMFAIPLTSVREIIQVTPEDISTIEGFEVIKFRDETIPVLRMNSVFSLKDYDSSKQLRYLVLATTGVKTVGFLVEELVGEQDVVIKPLAEHVCESRGLAGSTILGDGTIALVLDVPEVIEDVIAKQRQFAATGFRYAQQVYNNSLVGTPDM